MEGGLSAGAIDWSAPWLAPYVPHGRSVGAAWCAGTPLPQALDAQAGEAAPVRFVPQEALPAGMAYERFIHEQRRCPTRDNLHDFFNGLCWLALPQSKRRMNECQAAQIARAGVGAARGPVRDALTLLDENGALLQAPPLLWQALVQRDWRALFVERRPLWTEARLLVVGHALLEKLVSPRKDLTAHVWCVPCPSADMAAADAWLADQLQPPLLATKPFTPLPVMGIPGWCAANENFSFYDDSLVFRPARRARAGVGQQAQA